jgi:translation initiation factor 4G
MPVPDNLTKQVPILKSTITSSSEIPSTVQPTISNLESNQTQTLNEPVKQQPQQQQQDPSIVVNCWTPENKDAKKRYDRDFLLSLKDKKLSKAFPEVLQNFELAVLDQMASHQQLNNPMNKSQMMNQDQFGRIQQRGSYGGQSDQSGQLGGGFNRGSQHKQRGSNQQLSGGLGPNKKPSLGPDGHQTIGGVQINLPGANEIQIRNRAEKPYIPKKIMQTQSVESNETEDLFREVRNILNKLTPQNLQKLTSNLINLPINNEDRLKGAIDIIFEKSIDEQVFSQTYAQLCKVLSSIKVPSNAEPLKNVNFRTMLLTRCQKEFDTDYYQEINYDKLIQEVDQCVDEQKKRELKELADEKLGKAKRRSLGNIRFIGELFKLSMLTEGIMNDCIERLLKQETDEENLECLCRLLTTIGKEVDKTNNVQKMKSYFERLDKITKKKDSCSARIRFMILDVIDLRKNQWVPRRKDNKPRPLEEIRKEAEEEQLRLEAEIAKNQNERRGQGRFFV